MSYNQNFTNYLFFHPDSLFICCLSNLFHRDREHIHCIVRFSISQKDKFYTPRVSYHIYRLANVCNSQFNLGNIRWIHDSRGIRYFRSCHDADHSRHTLRTSMLQAGTNSALALRLRDRLDRLSKWLSGRNNEYYLVVSRRFRHSPHSPLLGAAILHHHRRHTLRQRAFQADARSSFPFRQEYQLTLAAHSK